jgi:polyisoprenoid-binding protein YceI
MFQRILAVAVIGLLSAGALVACAPNPADNVPAAQVDTGAVTGATVESPVVAVESPVVEMATEVPAANLPVGTFPLTGTLVFKASKVTATHHVEFKVWEGTYESDGTLAGTKLNFAGDLASLVVDENNRGPLTGKLETHLKSKDFFNVEVNPKAFFTSTAIVAGVDPVQFANATGATHTVSGVLDIHGVTEDVSFPITVTDDGMGTISAKTEFSVNRQDFGLVYPGAPDDLIRDEVVISVDATLVAAN